MNMQPTQLDAYKLIHDGTLALARAEQAGMRIDVEYCEKKKTHLTRKIARIEDNLSKTDLVKQWKKINRQNFNMDSNDQLGKILYDVMGIKPPKETKSGKGSTDEDTLSQIDLPELKDILRIRKLRKVRDTYLDAFVREQVNGWLHPFFNLHTVRTFRSSSSDPNFQNIPKRDKEAMNICRRAIFPREGHQLIEVDFSGLEVSIAACVTKDTLIETSEGPISILKIIRTLRQNKKVYVYGFDSNQNKLILSQVTEGGLTRRKTEIWEVKLDNDKIVRATPDHKFMMRDGSYKQLKDLNPGDSLMPFYKKKEKSSYGTVYRKVYLNNGKWEEFSETYNHKVTSIKKIGYDDVYNINVEKIHNYATAAGVIIKNCYHKDPTMMKYLKDPDSDMHGDMAAQIFCIDDFDKKKHPEHKYLRNATKNSFVFPQFYGDYYANNAQGFCNSWVHLPLGRWKPGTGPDMPGGMKLSDHMISNGIKSYQDFEDHMKKIEKDFWGRRFYVYQKWKDSWVEAYQKKGFFDMYTGFRCSGIMKKNEVINYPVQGAAFHCLLWSFIQLDKILVGNYKSRLIGQIHDAVILDVHPDELEEIGYIIKKVTCRDLPEAWKWICVPLSVDADAGTVDGSWNTLKPISI